MAPALASFFGACVCPVPPSCIQEELQQRSASLQQQLSDALQQLQAQQGLALHWEQQCGAAEQQVQQLQQAGEQLRAQLSAADAVRQVSACLHSAYNQRTWAFTKPDTGLPCMWGLPRTHIDTCAWHGSAQW
jgi:hypothetical protein